MHFGIFQALKAVQLEHKNTSASFITNRMKWSNFTLNPSAKNKNALIYEGKCILCTKPPCRDHAGTPLAVWQAALEGFVGGFLLYAFCYCVSKICVFVIHGGIELLCSMYYCKTLEYLLFYVYLIAWVLCSEYLLLF